MNPTQPPPQAFPMKTSGVVGEGRPRAWGRMMARPGALDAVGPIGGLGGACAGLAGYQWLAHDGSAASVLLALAVGATVGAVLFVVIVGLKYAVLPSNYARQMPVGSPMSGEFGPQSISVAIGNYRHHAELGPKTRIAMRDEVMVVVPGGEKRAGAFIVPRELVPSDLAARYLREYGPEKR